MTRTPGRVWADSKPICNQISKMARTVEDSEAEALVECLSSLEMAAELADHLVKSAGAYGPPGSVKNQIYRKAIRKKLLHHPNLENKDVVRSKWIRLLASRPSLYQCWNDIVECGRQKELLRLDLSLLEKELVPTDQKDVMKAIMMQYVAGGPSCCDEILDGFEVIPGNNPHIRWRDGDRMMDMTCMRLEKLSIVRDDEFHFDITDLWDRDKEDDDVLLAWEERARAWKVDGVGGGGGQKSAPKDPLMEKLLRDFVGFVYVVQGHRLVSFRQEVCLRSYEKRSDCAFANWIVSETTGSRRERE